MRFEYLVIKRSLLAGGDLILSQWPERHTHTAQSMCCQVMSAERNPEGIPERLRDLGIQKWVKGLDPSRVGIWGENPK